MKALLLVVASLALSVWGDPLQRPPTRINDLPIFNPYNPEKAPNVPIVLGERRCDNIYHGAILPCLLRPELPPYSYSTETMYNTEYKKKKK